MSCCCRGRPKKAAALRLFLCTVSVTARGGSSGHDDPRVLFHKRHNRGHGGCATRGPVTNKISVPAGGELSLVRQRTAGAAGGGTGTRAPPPRCVGSKTACLPVSLSCPVCRHACAAPPLLVPRLVLVRVPSAALAAAAERRPLARRRRARGTALACACGGVRLGVTIRVRVRVQVTMTLALTLPCGV